MKMHPTVKKLLSEIEDYCARSGTSQTAFGLRVMRDGNFVSRVRAGRLPGIKTFDRVRAFIDLNTKATRHKWKRK